MSKNKKIKNQTTNGTISKTYGRRGLGVESFGMPTDLEAIVALEPPTGLKEYYKMRANDPIIGGIMWQIETIFSRCKISWDGEVPEKVKSALSESFWSQILTEISSTMTYGFYVGELIWQIIDGLPMLIDIEPRFQTSIAKFPGKVIEQDAVDGHAEIPVEKALHVTIGGEARSPYGTSFLRSVYKPYYIKTHIEASEANSLDRDLAGLPVMTAPEGFDFMKADSENATYEESVADTLTWATEVVQNIRKDTQQGVVAPYGWELKLLRAEGEARDTSEPIRRHNEAICVGLLESFLAATVSGKGRSSQSEVHLSVLTNGINAMAVKFIDTINLQVISKLQRIYGFTGKLGVVPVTSYNLKDLASFVGRLISQGAITPTPTLENALLGIVDMPYVPGEKS